MQEFQHGLHLIADLKECDSVLLNDKRKLQDFLNGLPAQIGMRVLIPAEVKRVAPPTVPHGWEGLTGIVVVIESHISVHTFPAWGAVYADVFSCKAFGHKAVLNELIEAFGSKRYDKHVIKRMYHP